MAEKLDVNCWEDKIAVAGLSLSVLRWPLLGYYCQREGGSANQGVEHPRKPVGYTVVVFAVGILAGMMVGHCKLAGMMVGHCKLAETDQRCRLEKEAGDCCR